MYRKFPAEKKCNLVYRRVACLNPQVPSNPKNGFSWYASNTSSPPNGWESSAMLLLCFSWRHLCDVRWKEFVESGLYPVLLHQWNLKVVVIHTVIKLPFDLSEFYRMDQTFQQLVMRLFGWFSNTLPIGIFYKKETIWKYYFSLYQSETFQKLLVTSKVYLIGNLLRSPSSSPAMRAAFILCIQFESKEGWITLASLKPRISFLTSCINSTKNRIYSLWSFVQNIHRAESFMHRKREWSRMKGT